MSRTLRCYAMRGALRAAAWAAVLAIVAVVIAGCTTIDLGNPPPADFPTMRVTIHHVHGGEVFKACYRFVPLYQQLLGAIPEGCAYLDFAANTCTIWVRGDYPSKRVLEHELLHCKGYAHGDDEFYRAWEEYRKELLNLTGERK